METSNALPQPGQTAIRIPAHIISYLFHPIFIPSYVTAFLLYIHPYAFAGVSDKQKLFRLLFIVFSTAFLPAFSVLLMRALGFIKSVYLRTPRERIIPYSAAMVFYFWVWYVSKNLGDSPIYFTQFLLGTFLSVCGAWFFNIYYKISMHSTAVGGLMTFFLLQILSRQEDATGLYLAISVLIAGLVCTARFLVSDHSEKEIYSGLILGVLCQLVALVVT